MPRYIDSNKLEELCDIMAEKCDGLGESIWNQFRTMVEWIPTADVVDKERYTELLANAVIVSNALKECKAADVAKVVRCMYCKHYKQSEADPSRKMCRRKDVDGFLVCYDFCPTDYCSYGDRRDDGCFN